MPGRTGAGPKAFPRMKEPFSACAVFARYIRNPFRIKQSSCRGDAFKVRIPQVLRGRKEKCPNGLRVREIAAELFYCSVTSPPAGMEPSGLMRVAVAVVPIGLML